MTIDPRDFYNHLATSNVATPPSPAQVQFRTVELSAAWTMLQDWLRVGIEAKEKELASYMEAFQKSPDYRHDALVKHKVSIDNLSVAVYLLKEIEAKVLSFHKEEESK